MIRKIKFLKVFMCILACFLTFIVSNVKADIPYTDDIVWAFHVLVPIDADSSRPATSSDVDSIAVFLVDSTDTIRSGTPDYISDGMWWIRFDALTTSDSVGTYELKALVILARGDTLAGGEMITIFDPFVPNVDTIYYVQQVITWGDSIITLMNNAFAKMFTSVDCDSLVSWAYPLNSAAAKDSIVAWCKTSDTDSTRIGVIQYIEGSGGQVDRFIWSR